MEAILSGKAVRRPAARPWLPWCVVVLLAAAIAALPAMGELAPCGEGEYYDTQAGLCSPCHESCRNACSGNSSAHCSALPAAWQAGLDCAPGYTTAWEVPDHGETPEAVACVVREAPELLGAFTGSTFGQADTGVFTVTGTQKPTPVVSASRLGGTISAIAVDAAGERLYAGLYRDSTSEPLVVRTDLSGRFRYEIDLDTMTCGMRGTSVADLAADPDPDRRALFVLTRGSYPCLMWVTPNLDIGVLSTSSLMTTIAFDHSGAEKRLWAGYSAEDDGRLVDYFVVDSLTWGTDQISVVRGGDELVDVYDGNVAVNSIDVDPTGTVLFTVSESPRALFILAEGTTGFTQQLQFKGIMQTGVNGGVYVASSDLLFTRYETSGHVVTGTPWNGQTWRSLVGTETDSYDVDIIVIAQTSPNMVDAAVIRPPVRPVGLECGPQCATCNTLSGTCATSAGELDCTIGYWAIMGECVPPADLQDIDRLPTLCPTSVSGTATGTWTLDLDRLRCDLECSSGYLHTIDSVPHRLDGFAWRCDAYTQCNSSEYEAVPPTSTSDRACTACSAACTSCHGPDESDCTLESDSLACSPGYYDPGAEVGGDNNVRRLDTADRTCQRCSTACDTCHGPNSTDCSALEDNTLACSPGYYDTDSTPDNLRRLKSGRRQCASCGVCPPTHWSPSGCPEQTADCTPCDTCSEGEGEFEASPCNATANAVCSFCEASCRSCTGPSEWDCAAKANSTTLDCSDGYFDDGSTWVDPDGATRPRCQQCADECSPGMFVSQPCTASSDTVCEACSAPCGPEQFESAGCDGISDRVCTSCDPACVSCYGPSAEDCDFCADDAFGGPQYGSPCTLCRTCSDSEYEASPCGANNDRVCEACDPACATCYGSSSHRCGSGSEEPPDCATGYYDESESEEYETTEGGVRPECVACDSCPEGFTSAAECHTGGEPCRPCAECGQGKYIVAPCTSTQDTHCDGCSPACRSCYGPSSSECGLNDITGIYDCADGYYSHTTEGGVAGCYPCSTGCPAGEFISRQCTGTTDLECKRCTECAPDEYVVADCSEQSDRQCGTCDPSCSTCDGPSSSDCEVCAVGRFKVQEDDESLCKPCSACERGEFERSACAAENDTVCEPCPPACNTCYGAEATDCDEIDGLRDCAGGFFAWTGLAQDGSGTVTECRACGTCPKGSWSASGCPTLHDDCVPCMPCSSTGGVFEASSCNATTDTICAPCSTGCGTCSGPAASECNLNSSGVRECAVGHFDDGTGCRACSTGCPVGTFESSPCSATNDIVCQPCTDCVAGQFEAAPCQGTEDRVCASCHSTCATCYGGDRSECRSCATGTVVRSVDGIVYCEPCQVCDIGEYEVQPCGEQERICGECHPACGSCVGHSSAECAPLGLSVNCSAGYVPIMTGEEVGSGFDCRPCGSCGAGTWSTSGCPDVYHDCTSCSTCEPGTFELSSCTSTADRGCGRCHAACGSCVGPSSAECAPLGLSVNCSAGYAPAMTDRDGSGLECIPCGSCTAGMWSTSGCPAIYDDCTPCSTCDSDFFALESCTSMNDTVCEPCFSGCDACTHAGPSGCTSCSVGYFWEADRGCQRCHRACSSCTGPDAAACSHLPQEMGDLARACAPGFISVNATCATATNSSSGCPAPWEWFSSRGACLVPTQCAQSEYHTEDNTCMPCEAGCESCSGPDGAGCVQASASDGEDGSQPTSDATASSEGHAGQVVNPPVDVPGVGGEEALHDVSLAAGRAVAGTVATVSAGAAAASAVAASATSAVGAAGSIASSAVGSAASSAVSSAAAASAASAASSSATAGSSAAASGLTAGAPGGASATVSSGATATPTMSSAGSGAGTPTVTNHVDTAAVGSGEGVGFFDSLDVFQFIAMQRMIPVRGRPPLMDGFLEAFSWSVTPGLGRAALPGQNGWATAHVLGFSGCNGADVLNATLANGHHSDAPLHGVISFSLALGIEPQDFFAHHVAVIVLLWAACAVIETLIYMASLLLRSRLGHKAGRARLAARALTLRCTLAATSPLAVAAFFQLNVVCGADPWLDTVALIAVVALIVGQVVAGVVGVRKYDTAMAALRVAESGDFDVEAVNGGADGRTVAVAALRRRTEEIKQLWGAFFARFRPGGRRYFFLVLLAGKVCFAAVLVFTPIEHVMLQVAILTGLHLALLFLVGWVVKPFKDGYQQHVETAAWAARSVSIGMAFTWLERQSAQGRGALASSYIAIALQIAVLLALTSVQLRKTCHLCGCGNRYSKLGIRSPRGRGKRSRRKRPKRNMELATIGGAAPAASDVVACDDVEFWKVNPLSPTSGALRRPPQRNSGGTSRRGRAAARARPQGRGAGLQSTRPQRLSALRITLPKARKSFRPLAASPT